MLEVLVIGGGPAGSFVASRLAAMGSSVTLLDKKESHNEPVCCTGIISRECVSEFDIDEDVIIRWFKGASLFSPSGHRIKLERPQDQACAIDRAAFDAMMLERAANAGADVKLGHQVLSIVPDETDITVAATCGGQEVSFRARVVVVAAGFNPAMGNKLDISQPGSYAIGAHAEVEADGLSEVEVYSGNGVAPGFFCWLVPLAGGNARAGLLTRKQPQAHLKRFLEKMVAAGRVKRGEYYIDSRPVPLAPVSPSYGNRFILLGDSAGQTKPITGGGIYFGLKSAAIAAEVLHEALQNDELDATALSEYEKRWQGLLEQDIKLGRLARLLYERLNDKQLDTAFGVLEQSGFIDDMLKEKELTFDWHGKVLLSLARRKLLDKVGRVLQVPFSLKW